MFMLMITYVLLVQVTCEEPDLEPLPDYYAMLNVSHTAEMRDIKRSFRKLAMDYHPDKNKSEHAQIIFQELSEAYSVLSNPEKKMEYDHLFRIFFDIDHEEHNAGDVDNDATDDKANSTDENVRDTQEDAKEDTNENQSASGETDPKNSKAKQTSDSSGDEASSEESSSSDLDDETLYKVLKFLADNDYVITKRTRKVPSSTHDREETNEARDEQTSFRYSQHNRSGNGFEYRKSAYMNTDHKHHDHPWTTSHTHKPRFAKRSADSKNQFQNQFKASEQVYCQTSTRWEGTVKITSRTCF